MRVHLFLVICRIWVHLLSIPIRYVDADRAVTVEGSVIENGSIPPPLTVFNETSVNTTRIVGGTWVKRGAHPYQAAIMLSGILNCGGTLVNSKHVLTAAHCLAISGFDIDANNLVVFLRTTTLIPLDPDHIQVGVASFTIHPGYNETTFENDIAIIKLAKAVNVRPVRLEPAGSNRSYTGKIAKVIGWGRTRQVLFPDISYGPSSNHLRQVNLTIIAHSDCSILYHQQYQFQDNDRLCAATLHGKGICQGDSGGPLFIDGIQVGVNSAAAGCADPRYPAIFIRIARHRSWISANTVLKRLM